jgi:hypothetical protein
MRLITKSIKLNSLNTVRSDAVKHAGAETPQLRHVLNAMRTIQHRVTWKRHRDWHLTQKKNITGTPWNHEVVNSIQNINTQTSTFHVTTYFEVYPIRTVQNRSNAQVLGVQFTGLWVKILNTEKQVNRFFTSQCSRNRYTLAFIDIK